MTIVPALMFLLGRSNWWFPAWLDRILPRLSVDPESAPPDSPVDETSLPESDPLPV
jgi:RND superfamily putative drug exporter